MDEICPDEIDDGEHLWACQGFTGHSGDHWHAHGPWKVHWGEEGWFMWSYDIRKELRK